ncbi:MAG: S41 family peptidase [Desulfoplanes sp.]
MHSNTLEEIMRLSHMVGTAILLGTLLITSGSGLATKDDPYASLKRFSQILDMVEENYVQKVDRDDLIKGAIEGMLQELDPHSSLLSKKDFETTQEDLSGKFGGIGIQIGLKNRQLTVIAPIEDTPAFKAGLKTGDIIFEIDGESALDITLMEAVGKIRGPKGTSVTLTVLHKGSSSPDKITIVRGTIPALSVKTQELEPGYLYLRLTEFKATSVQEMRKALNAYTKKQALKGLILDLRSNPGGILSQAVDISDTFLSDGLIVYTQGRDKDSRREFVAKKQSSDVTCPLVVLVNSGSASASEIVAGALQDQKRALILGEKSFGKGSVQTIIPLADGSAIKLTIALYYTPNGRSIQAEGIVPDIEYPFVPPSTEEEQTFLEFREKDFSKHLENPNGKDGDTKVEESAAQKENMVKADEMLSRDNQLRMALELVKQLPRISQIH